MATRDSIRPTRRALLAAPLILPALPSLAADRVNGLDLAYLANNLRRADDKAKRIHAPLDTAATWRWLASHARHANDLSPHEHRELMADIAGVNLHELRQAQWGIA